MLLSIYEVICIRNENMQNNQMTTVKLIPEETRYKKYQEINKFTTIVWFVVKIINIITWLFDVRNWYVGEILFLILHFILHRNQDLLIHYTFNSHCFEIFYIKKQVMISTRTKYRLLEELKIYPNADLIN